MGRLPKSFHHLELSNRAFRGGRRRASVDISRVAAAGVPRGPGPSRSGAQAKPTKSSPTGAGDRAPAPGETTTTTTRSKTSRSRRPPPRPSPAPQRRRRLRLRRQRKVGCLSQEREGELFERSSIQIPGPGSLTLSPYSLDQTPRRTAPPGPEGTRHEHRGQVVRTRAGAEVRRHQGLRPWQRTPRRDGFV